ncbi:hypothetical protein K9U39_19505 [Rhodoblastus acidophilus]|nr:hypothetical protein [Rhodoblastus acidophilus]
MLHHPTQAGAYVFGRRRQDWRRQLPGKPPSDRRFVRDPQNWTVLPQNAFSAYIEWSVFENNQRQMAMNRSRYPGVPRGGSCRATISMRTRVNQDENLLEEGRSPTRGTA